MKVLHVFHDYGPFHKELIRVEREMGIDAVGLHFTTRYKSGLHADSPDITVQNSPIRFRRSPLFFNVRIKRAGKDALPFCVEAEPDIIHAHMLFTDGSVALDMHEETGAPYIVAVRNADINTPSFWKDPRTRARGFEVLRKASSIVFLTSAYRGKLLSKLPEELGSCVASKSVISKNGVSSFWHEHAAKHPKSIDGDVRILTVGQICSNKNQETVMEAVELLRAELGKRVAYTCVGEATDANIAGKLLACQDVNVCPHCDEERLLGYYNDADVFVLPSIHETFGLVYVEAMSQGLPLVYTKGEGFDEQFHDGEVGYSVDPLSAAEIAQAVIRILENYDDLSKNCIEGSKAFQWSDIAAAYTRLYRNILP